MYCISICPYRFFNKISETFEKLRVSDIWVAFTLEVISVTLLFIVILFSITRYFIKGPSTVERSEIVCIFIFCYCLYAIRVIILSGPNQQNYSAFSIIVSPGRYCRRIFWIQQRYAASATASHSCVRSNSCISWRISFKFCMEVYLGKIYTPIVFGDAAPSVPSFIGSKVILVEILCALCRPHFLTDFFQILYRCAS